MIKAAGAAPSGKNIQNWHFVVIKRRDLMEKIADVITKKPVPYTHPRAHVNREEPGCRLLLEKKKKSRRKHEARATMKDEQKDEV
ncbi:nitroreductase family protein, partial [Clostridioides difficile]|uniref:nitroreductase family protein n=1 Tax=Clostridioides difficile TaxID=1496 RepID=UPI000BD52455